MPSWPSSQPLALGVLQIPLSGSDPPTEVPDEIPGYIPAIVDPGDRTLWLWYDGVWNPFEPGGGGGWQFGTNAPGPYQREQASTDLLGINFLAWDRYGGTPYVCNGESWIQTAPGLSEPPVVHGPEAHTDEVGGAEVNEALSKQLLFGNLHADPPTRPQANTDILGTMYEALDVDGGTPFGCNGESWVQLAAGVNAPPAMHGAEAHQVGGITPVGERIVVVKPFDESWTTVYSSLALHADADLHFPVFANQQWLWDLYLYYDGASLSTEGDIRWGMVALDSFGAPDGGAAGRYGYPAAADISTTGLTGASYVPRAGHTTDYTTGGAFNNGSVGVGTAVPIRAFGFVRPASNGTVGLHWAQRLASATATTVKFYSVLVAERIL